MNISFICAKYRIRCEKIEGMPDSSVSCVSAGVDAQPAGVVGTGYDHSFTISSFSQLLYWKGFFFFKRGLFKAMDIIFMCAKCRVRCMNVVQTSNEL